MEGSSTASGRWHADAKEHDHHTEVQIESYINRACELSQIALLFWVKTTRFKGLSVELFERGLRKIVSHSDCEDPNFNYPLNDLTYLWDHPTEKYRAPDNSDPYNVCESPLSYIINYISKVSFIRAFCKVMGERLNIDFLSNYGHTQLINAICCKKNAIAAFLLLECNANPDMSNIYDRTPLLIAAEKDCQMVSITYAKTGQGISKSLVDILLEQNADPNKQDSTHEHSPLHAAIICGRLKNFKSLIKAGADPNIYTRNILFEQNNDGLIPREQMKGIIPLNTALATGQFAMAKTILEVSSVPAVGLQDDYNYTPLHYFVRYLSSKYRFIKKDKHKLIYQVMLLILQQGCSLDEKLLDSRMPPQQIPSPRRYLDYLDRSAPDFIRRLYMSVASVACGGGRFETPYKYGFSFFNAEKCSNPDKMELANEDHTYGYIENLQLSQFLDYEECDDQRNYLSNEDEDDGEGHSSYTHDYGNEDSDEDEDPSPIKKRTRESHNGSSSLSKPSSHSNDGQGHSSKRMMR